MSHLVSRAVVVLVGVIVLGAATSLGAPTPSNAAGVPATITPSLATTTENDTVTLAATPPMGWNSWNQVRCYDLTEDVVKRAADTVASTGLAAAGYEYIVVDDCWQDLTRASDGTLRSNPERFPSGIKALADYVHARGLKFGIYGSPGTDTCAMYWDGYPGKNLGSYGYEELDARTFASWGVDYLKYDWCRADITSGLEPIPAFTKMRDALRATGRPIVYSISEYGDTKPWTWAQGIANLWRTTNDLGPTWASVSNVINRQASLADYTGRPGGWNDPDMLQIGNGSLTDVENRTHFTMWSILNAPLFLGTDLERLSPTTMATVTNPEVIAIDQDWAGSQGRRLSQDGPAEVWGKKLSDGGYAVVLYNSGNESALVRTDLAALGLDPGGRGWVVRDAWQREDVANTRGSISAVVPPHGATLYRLRPAPRAAGLTSAVTVTAEPSAVGAGTVTDGELTVTNSGATPLLKPEVSLTAPAGLDVEMVGTLPAAIGPGQIVQVPVRFTADADAVESRTVLVDITARSPSGARTTQRTAVTVTVTPPAPSGSTWVSDLAFVSSSNGWGPVERDLSNGEQAQSDGSALTIDGVTHEKGLGVHARSETSLYLGGACRRFTASVGVDDEVGDLGSVRFSVVGDDGTLYRSETLRGPDGAAEVSVDVSGVRFLDLVVDDAGDGVGSDHADWGSARLDCS
ncbi:alpha-galactosidase [Knoellia remsis]|uniref:Alpha-galactosidase n=1 Tax=Knoellia remsis TaxID=407159 RepID=A0A2T0TZ40_9MICO|nr:NPCBM/NEW2 domain-containing protein [Knoellia remsis]PRY50936.1 alpha-galactosidase [Knoellia remsis]